MRRELGWEFHYFGRTFDLDRSTAPPHHTRYKSAPVTGLTTKNLFHHTLVNRYGFGMCQRIQSRQQPTTQLRTCSLRSPHDGRGIQNNSTSSQRISHPTKIPQSHVQQPHSQPQPRQPRQQQRRRQPASTPTPKLPTLVQINQAATISIDRQ